MDCQQVNAKNAESNIVEIAPLIHVIVFHAKVHIICIWTTITFSNVCHAQWKTAVFVTLTMMIASRALKATNMFKMMIRQATVHNAQQDALDAILL